MNRERILAVLYDLAMVVGGEVRLKPLLTKTLQRLLYHTSFPAGAVFLDLPQGDGMLEVRLELAVGDFDLAKHTGSPLRLPAALLNGPAALVADAGLIDALPCAHDRYKVCLRLPMDGRGVVLLFSPALPVTELPLTEVFQPVMANLAKAVMLCRHNEAYTQSILADRDQALAGLERFRAALDASSDGAFLVDPIAMRFVDANRTAEVLTGYSREELLKLRPEHLVFEGDSRRLAGLFVEMVEGRKEAELDTFLLRRDGSRMPADVRLNLFASTRGEWLVIALVRDVTERKRAETALRKVNRTLRTLSAGNLTLVHATDESQLLGDVCQVITGIGGYPLAWVGLLEGDKGLVLRAQAGLSQDVPITDLAASCRSGGGGVCPCGQTLLDGELRVVRNLPEDRCGGALWREEALSRGFSSYIVLPLQAYGEMLGVLNIYSAEAKAFDDEEVRLLSEMAADLAFGIVTLRTRKQRDASEEASKRYLAQLQKTLEQAVAAIALTIEKRDPYTAGHQRRTALLAVAIAKLLGLPSKQQEGLYFGGLVHDIGKINVPVEILNRPGRISELEYQIIKSHPEVGYEIMKDIEFPWPVAQMIHQHHERLDGSGYPLGLKGDAILLEARILSVADVVEAIASHRPYRPGLGIDVALEEIVSHRGVFFDEAAVDACVRLFREEGYRFEA